MKKTIITAAFLMLASSLRGQMPMDKISHLAVGGSIAGFTYAVTHKLTANKWTPTIAGMAVAVTTAFGKEYIDNKRWNSPINESIKDIAFTTLGAGLACLTLKIAF